MALSAASEGGLPATGTQQQETPPARTGDEHDAGEAAKGTEHESDPASSGDDPEKRHDEEPAGFKKRLNRANRDRDVARGQEAAARARIDALEAELKKLRPAGTEPAAEQRSERHEPVNDHAAHARQARLEDFTEDGEDKYDDYSEVVVDNPRLRVTTTMADEMMDVENGVDVAYYLGKNPKEARRIATLGERAQAREIGRLAAKLELEDPASEKAGKPVARVSKAPAPIDSVAGKKPNAGTELRGDLSMEEYVRRRNAMLKTEGRRF